MEIIHQQISSGVQGTKDGEVNPLEFYCELKALLDYGKTCLDEVKDLAFEEADKYAENSFELHGYKITKTKGRVTYDYSKHEEVKRLDSERKKITTILKRASELGKTIIDEDTGEAFQPCPIKSSTGESLSIKKI